MMEKKNINYYEIKKEKDILDQVLNKYNPTLSARDIYMENLNDNVESQGFVYIEEDHSFDDVEP